jgi:hypothetical protein
MDYVGGDEALSEIERDKLSLQEVKGFAKDHLAWKDSMKLYFLLPGKELINGLVFLFDDSGCLRMADYIDVGSVADVYIEYHGEEDTDDSKSGSDYEDDELWAEEAEEPDGVMTADSHDVFVTDDTGVVTDFICSPVKKKQCSARSTTIDDDDVVLTGAPISQVDNPTQHPTNADGASENSESDSDSDVEYIPHSEDSGEYSEVAELRRHARKFKK